jgi:hypothetical protein
VAVDLGNPVDDEERGDDDVGAYFEEERGLERANWSQHGDIISI